MCYFSVYICSYISSPKLLILLFPILVLEFYMSFVGVLDYDDYSSETNFSKAQIKLKHLF
jgi:hypothetical protein